LGVALAIAVRLRPAELPARCKERFLEEAADALLWVDRQGKANGLALYNLALIKARGPRHML
jgi:hypothetical protein